MDEQKLLQLLNEQSLVNMSIIEQLNQQAVYLNSIVERLELISEYLNNQSLSGGERIDIRPLDSVPLSETKNQEEQKQEDNLNDIPLNHPNAILFDEAMIERIHASETIHEESNEETMDNEEVVNEELDEIESQETDGDVTPATTQTPNMVPAIDEIFLFGDRIRVINDNFDETGVFVELNDDYLVWVIDDAQLTFTNISGATIIRLT